MDPIEEQHYRKKYGDRPPIGWLYAILHFAGIVGAYYYSRNHGGVWPWGIVVMVLLFISFHMVNGIQAVWDEGKAIRRILEDRLRDN